MSLTFTAHDTLNLTGNPVGESIQAIEKELFSCVKASHLSVPPPQLIAVSKQQSPERIRQALIAGHRHFGENRIQEAGSKWQELKKDYPDSVLHLIGALQSNKAAEAVSLFDVIHSIDRDSVARAVKIACDAQHRQVTCLVQVNTGEEPQKGGVLPNELGALLDYCRNEVRLTISGLMCLPPANENPAPHFAFLAKLAKRHDLPTLSMGMSGDYRIAASLGASYVRIGTAIFGERG